MLETLKKNPKFTSNKAYNLDLNHFGLEFQFPMLKAIVHEHKGHRNLTIF